MNVLFCSLQGDVHTLPWRWGMRSKASLTLMYVDMEYKKTRRIHKFLYRRILWCVYASHIIWEGFSASQLTNLHFLSASELYRKKKVFRSVIHHLFVRFIPTSTQETSAPATYAKNKGLLRVECGTSVWLLLQLDSIPLHDLSAVLWLFAQKKGEKKLFQVFVWGRRICIPTQSLLAGQIFVIAFVSLALVLRSCSCPFLIVDVKNLN